MSTQHCRSCGAAVTWLTNDKTGKVAPIDAAPNPDGNVNQIYGGRYHVLAKAERESALYPLTYTSHWQTCIHRAAWKAKQERGTA